MKVLKSASDKIQEICDTIKEESLKPAKEEAKRLIEEAEKEARRIKHEAEKEAEKLLEETQKTIKQERNVFHSSLQQAAKQAVEGLRQAVTKNLFNRELSAMIEKSASDKDTVAKLIEAIVEALKKEGMEANLSAYIPQKVSPEEVNKSLSKSVLEKLSNQTVNVGEFKGGAQVKVVGKNLTIDISDSALKELFSKYLKKPEFRELIFNTEG
ncbi:MAG: V-type ATP synthase subunit E [Chlamydiia bacterium]|nr:V-type ATP synthase subunit E [Chlamydiia bacterium]